MKSKHVIIAKLMYVLNTFLNQGERTIHEVEAAVIPAHLMFALNSSLNYTESRFKKD